MERQVQIDGAQCNVKIQMDKGFIVKTKPMLKPCKILLLYISVE